MRAAGATTLTANVDGQDVGVQRGDRRQRRRAQGRGVVHQQVEAAAGIDLGQQTGSVVGIGDVADDGGHGVSRASSATVAEGGGIAAVGDHVPTPSDEGADQGPSQAPRSAGDHCDGAGGVHGRGLHGVLLSGRTI